VTILPTWAGFLIRNRPSRAPSRGPLTRSPDQFRPSLDTPYVRDVVKHIGSQQWAVEPPLLPPVAVPSAIPLRASILPSG
jgi:hypothetical protein